MITPELLRRFQQGYCTPEELAVLRQYLKNDSLPELEKMLDDDWYGSAWDAGDSAARERVRNRLRESMEKHETLHTKLTGNKIRHSNWLPKWPWSVAASLLFLILAGGGYFIWEKQKGYHGNALMTEINEGSGTEIVKLDDGSVVWLYPGGKLQYRRTFLPGSRQVSLNGRAFFSVTKDAARPFYVQTAKLTVKVLGTSFTVNSYERNHDAEVSVHSGKVTVSRAGEKSDIILLPNERVSFHDQIRPVKRLAEAPVIVDHTIAETAFEFSGTPVPAVFEMLKKAYKVNIVYDAEMVKNCTLTARLCDQPLFTKLEMICATIGASYQVKDMSIYVTVSEGCSGNE